ncbi:hypothetical protein [Nocardia cyriacigeorgica]|uniref:hypothetical protein n=1 Tax=Nocardia cyriacigeorgica TaxID=135487 RepID=UPI0013D40A6E|nr:hypothetical protein [Nocardia cyriacigeorgica]NEW29181.1 hypothetical protein [Nocardia cyriacigeorgica]
MVGRFETPEQVREYLAGALRTNRTFWVLPTEHGWVAQEVLTPEEMASGQGVGLGNYVVNRQTGVITAHSSLAPQTIGEMYDEAIRTGRPVQGYQVYPATWRVHIERTRETAAEIEYRVQAESLTVPPAEPPVQRLLTINKHSLRYHTDTRATHVTCRQATGWAQARSRQNGTWPPTGTFEF